MPVYDLVVAMGEDGAGRSCRSYFQPLVCDGVPVLQDGKQMHVRFTVTAQGHTTSERGERGDRGASLSMSLP